MEIPMKLLEPMKWLNWIECVFYAENFWVKTNLKACARTVTVASKLNVTESEVKMIWWKL